MAAPPGKRGKERNAPLRADRGGALRPAGSPAPGAPHVRARRRGAGGRTVRRATRRVYNRRVEDPTFAGWTPQQIADARRWVRTWRAAGPRLEQVRRTELRRLDQRRAIALLCGEADYTVPPRAPRPTSGLVEQQRWFMKAAGRGEWRTAGSAATGSALVHEGGRPR